MGRIGNSRRETIGRIIKNKKIIILAKGVIGKYFNGFILSTTHSTTLEVNPNLPSSKELLDLYKIFTALHKIFNLTILIFIY
ncbi:hypothetical protein MA16_Dca021028 [Dendrobium catenatum]|uniref:Uncharacterized protein n=1 Tax=Dendrobium catenatum TaxID=906689 RepID=A0A2I0X622_9ASPA|nr:hypothetical protein MA16_Dca021028 [Dendrobium catenatum]